MGHCCHPEAGGEKKKTNITTSVLSFFFSHFLNGRDLKGRYAASQSINADAQRERLIAAASRNVSFFYFFFMPPCRILMSLQQMSQ